MINKENTPLFKWITGVLVFIIGVAAILYIGDTQPLSHIETIILQNNTVKESVENSKYPTINKPASSQETVIYGDSVRVFKKYLK